MRDFRYDPDTGSLLRRYRNGQTKELTATNPNGYIKLTPPYQSFSADRVIWLLVCKQLPKSTYEIQHINGNNSDNRLSNLVSICWKTGNREYPTYKPDPNKDLEYARRTFRYDPVTGKLFRIKSNGEKEITYVGGAGYITTSFRGKTKTVHRIAWLLTYGVFPKLPLEIDHINRVKTDNRISNLRLATRQENALNIKRSESVPPTPKEQSLAYLLKKYSKPINQVCSIAETSEIERVRGIEQRRGLSN